MLSKKSPSILVLGAQGMVGHTIYNYLQNFYRTYGTMRNNQGKIDFIQFDAEKDSLDKLHRKLKQIDYIINCIGVLPDTKNLSAMHKVNGIFPHNAARFAEEIGAKLLHISTDAVFAATTKDVYEDTATSPRDFYGQTKLEGEPISKNALTIRSSFLGLDPLNHKGLLEFILMEKMIKGYTNQNWSGCTTLEFAQLCKDIIQTNRFEMLRKKSSVYHFAPIRNVSKHDIINTFLKLNTSNNILTQGEGMLITRSLSSRYSKELHMKNYSTDLFDSLQELLQFESKNNA